MFIYFSPVEASCEIDRCCLFTFGIPALSDPEQVAAQPFLISYGARAWPRQVQAAWKAVRPRGNRLGDRPADTMC